MEDTVVDFTPLTDGISLASASTAIMSAAAALILVSITIVGVRRVIGIFR